MNKKTIKTLILAGVMVVFGAVGGALSLSMPTYASYDPEKPALLEYDDCYDGSGKLQASVSTWSSQHQMVCGTLAGGKSGDTKTLPEIVKNIINVLLYIIGIVAVVMIIFGGFQYITSSGDAAKVTKAKNTILYGSVGLVIAVLAYAIVNFVITGISA